MRAAPDGHRIVAGENVHTNHCIAALLVAAALLLTACSGTPDATTKPDQTKEAAAPPQPGAALSAYYAMYKPARAWATDLLPLSLTRGDVPGVENQGGKAAMWIAVFVSPSLRQARTLTWAAADSGSEIHKGVSIGGSQVWSGATQQSQPFQNTQILVDSEAAYKTAAADADVWLKKNPDKKLNVFTLVSASRFPAPVWYLQWGDKKSGYAAFVNATTGDVVKTRGK